MSNSESDEQTSKAAREREEMQDFLFLISHDLKTPLVSLRGFIELLNLRRDELPEQMVPWIEAMDRSAQTLQDLIEQILLLARDRDTFRAQEPTSIAEVATEVLAEFESIIAAQGVVARASSAPVSVPLQAWVVATLLRNLVRNALEHGLTEGAGRHLELSWSEADPDGWVRVEVSDDGAGMSAERLELVRSQALLRQRRKAVGGIGLYLTRKIVERLGGDLAVDSRPGEGTRVTLWLPVTGELSA